ncbi:hypothetical protein OTK49_02030 [Vibrio coralliirubri]|uniref:hypothetical protein n=1 Tax=Vibrio coralliirubri TaxID=1516159 RepID=UPI00228481E4|nr:hypothetical protein [Vibrio coralliirubri]MCY9861293.1 hypothetical protein [Vibrio coralliirubri]
MSNSETVFDTKAASEKLNRIINEQKAAIASSKIAISESSEQQRQPDELDAASGYSDMMVSTAQIRKSEATIEECVKALSYIRVGEFGLCRTCWDDIELSRITATPYLDCCSSCSKDKDAIGHNYSKHKAPSAMTRSL